MHHQNIPTSIRSFSIRKNRNNAIARENSHLIARIIISVLAGAPISEDALSQGFSQQPSQSEVLADESRQRRESKLAARVGKTYTAMFGQRHCNTTYSIPILPTPNFRGTQRYTSPHPISFVIDGVVAEPPNAIFKYFKITLQDGAIGYIDTIMFSAEDIAVANQIQIKTGPDYQECSAARSTRRGCGFVEHAAFTKRVRMVRRLKRRLNRYCT